MSFQWIMDYAETLSIDTKKIVASTQARDGTTRAVSRGGQIWKFDVKVPDGLRWRDMRTYIAASEALDKTTAANINLTNLPLIVGYQGNYASQTGVSGGIAIATSTQGSNTLTLTTASTLSVGQYKFRAGDYIQLGTGNVYKVAADVAYNSMSVTLHRPVIEASAAGIVVKVGTNISWSVICTNFPQWTLTEGTASLVAWDGNFTFVENLV
jgi:hypothetical protein